MTVTNIEHVILRKQKETELKLIDLQGVAEQFTPCFSEAVPARCGGTKLQRQCGYMVGDRFREGF